MSQLADLSKPIDARYVEKKPGGYDADYVSHPVIAQYLIGLLGRVPQQEIVREIYDADKLTGVVLRLTLVIDGQTVVIEEVGDDDGNAKNNGARLKNAVSDAYKRCAMRASCGLSLWAQENYFLDKSLAKRDENAHRTGAAS